MAKKDRLEYVKSCWKGSGIYCLSHSRTQNFLCQPTMVADIVRDFEPPSKKFLAMSLTKVYLFALSFLLVFFKNSQLEMDVKSHQFFCTVHLITVKAVKLNSASI